MSKDRPPRVMWLLNHGTARQFEIPMLKRIGIEEIYLPKIYPASPGFRSASVDWSQDEHLKIPEPDIEAMNKVNWYEDITQEAWSLAEKYFDIIFLILHQPNTLVGASMYFTGAVVWRCYGLNSDLGYHKLIREFERRTPIQRYINRLGRRFFFGEAYSHLADEEPEYLKARRCFLPLGLPEIPQGSQWDGTKARILFICPDIAFNQYYQKVYSDFVKCFGDLPYSIGGAQPVPVTASNVLGYVPSEQHEANMKQFRLMFYHSQEKNHIHFHPFEAIRAGMPLVFMAGGMLDRFGGTGLPGRCKTFAEARRKVRQILNGNWSLIERIRTSQRILLEPMRCEFAEPFWKQAFSVINREVAIQCKERAIDPFRDRRKKIAVLVPESYRGGTLRGAKLTAEALYVGSRAANQPVDITLFYLDSADYAAEDHFADLREEIVRRPFAWKTLTADRARRAMHYAGYHGWEPEPTQYIVPDDGVAQLQDYDLWLFISDRLRYPVVPIRPIAVFVYDYLQRYESIMAPDDDIPFLNAADHAHRVFVTTDFTYTDSIQYAGVKSANLRKLPMLAPEFPLERPDQAKPSSNYFLWTTSAAVQKNLENASRALRIYYEELDGDLECWVTGVNTANLLQGQLPHLKAAAGIFATSKLMRKRIKLKGELPEQTYRAALRNAHFLWHAGRIDNGTFTVIEAARLGVPSLSSDYPAMREIDRQFALQLAWMQADDPQQMAEQLKMMEREARNRRSQLPAIEQWQAQSVKALAPAYWEQVRQCL